VIAQSLGLGCTAVGEYIRRSAVIGTTSPIPENVDDSAIERKLFAASALVLQHQLSLVFLSGNSCRLGRFVKIAAKA
jgi:hypothetical protein